MWNSFKISDYEGMIAETIRINGHEGKPIRAYLARPLGAGPYPGITLIPHMPGWDEWLRETARRFAAHGFSVIVPNIFEDFGDGTPPEVSKRSMETGGATDKNVMEDVDASLAFLRNQTTSNGKVGVIGMCSGGRHTFLAAATLDGVDAAVDCWGGGVITPPEKLSPARPVAPIEYAEGIKCPILGIFGNDDVMPTPEEVNQTEEVLKKLGKTYEFHRYDGAGHGFWYYDRPMYRQEQAMDAWNKTLAFFDKYMK
uniref:Carboxymethylenebutenolidase n=1 Tax=uncultured bacterium Contigcl_1539 TaxID=1393650 RepID=W0FS84_9BACT|nr:carboxymethylenebutenolidase [uncultured bacterium Contigcl_1539]